MSLSDEAKIPKDKACSTVMLLRETALKTDSNVLVNHLGS